MSAWAPHLPDAMSVQWFSDMPGTLSGFCRGALVVLLAREEKVSSVADLYVADVERGLPGSKHDGPDGRVPRSKSPHAERTRANWMMMRRHMGDGAFDTLQRAVVRGGFRRDLGEPDLFCYARAPSRWFFAEAVNNVVGRWQSNPFGTGWFDLALKALGDPGRVRVYRLVAQE
ncbi:MAG: hypothetical protein ACRENE_24090 [Polyangiaceae bacterium]